MPDFPIFTVDFKISDSDKRLLDAFLKNPLQTPIIRFSDFEEHIQMCLRKGFFATEEAQRILNNGRRLIIRRKFRKKTERKWPMAI